MRGTLRHPAVGLKASKLATQGAAAVVLGAIGTPLAAIAAFVDPGLNKSADCQALLADAKSDGRTAADGVEKPQRRAAALKIASRIERLHARIVMCARQRRWPS
jgi:hypothetical protein